MTLSGGVCLSRETDNANVMHQSILFMTTSLDVKPKTIEWNLIVGISKSEAELIIDCARGTVGLLTDGHEASRGLSATAELLLYYSRFFDNTCFTLSSSGFNTLYQHFICHKDRNN